MTDRGEHGGLATAEYAQLQAFNADETRILMTNEDGTRSVMDFATGQVTHQGIDLALPRWSPLDRDALIGFDRPGGGTIHLQQLELQPGGTWVTHDLVNISALGYTSLDPACFEELSADGRYMTLVDGAKTKLSVLDLTTGQLRSTVRPPADVDWVAVSDSGRYLAVQYVPRGSGPGEGLSIYDAATGALLGHAADHHEHGDLGLDALGDDVYVTMGYTDSCASGNVACYSVSRLPNALESGTRHDLFRMPPAVGSYTSCRNNQGPGYCLNADDYASGPGVYPFAKEIWITRISDGAVKRLAHHRSSSCSYFELTRPTISRSGRYALFTSDWARPNCADQADLYLIDLTQVLDGWAVPPAARADAGVATSDAGLAPADAGFAGADAGLAPSTEGGADAGVADGGSRRRFRNASRQPMPTMTDLLRALQTSFTP